MSAYILETHRVPGVKEDRAVKYECPNCGRTVNFRVRKCVCGMEFK